MKYGVLVISHGSRDEKWVRLVDEAVHSAVLPEGMPVVSSFLEIVEGRLIQDGIDKLEAEGVKEIIVVPLFVSSGSTHVDEIRYALGVQEAPTLPTELEPFRKEVAVHCTDPIDDDPIIASIMLDKLRNVSANPAEELLLLIGHGSEEAGFHERWQQGLSQLAARLKRLGGFAEADTAMLLPDQLQGKIMRWRERRPELQAVVLPLFLSEGYFTNHVIPTRLRGCTYRYLAQALLPHPGITRWIEQQVQSVVTKQ